MRRLLINCFRLGLLCLSLVLGQACEPSFKSLAPKGLEVASAVPTDGLNEAIEAVQGKGLYDSKCASCHGPIETSSKLRASITDISRGIDSQPAMAILKTLGPIEIKAISLALDKEVPLVTCESAADVGKVTIHRLNKSEYSNTLRDLLGITPQVLQDMSFPDDEFATNFDNNAKVLSITTTHMTKYLEHAEKSVGLAFANSAARTRIVKTCDMNQDTCVQTILTSFLTRAFRRSPTTAELTYYTGIVRTAKTSGDTAEAAIKLALTGALISPNFIYRSPVHPSPNDKSRVVELSNYEMASRMSYFIWSSMPDDALLEAARLGQLRTREQLAVQAQRMLKDPKAISLIENFASNWVQLNDIEKVQPDQTLFPTFTSALKADLKSETRLLLKDIFDRDGSFFEILNADHTFLNERLAQHYGVPGVSGTQFRRVTLTGQDRIGLITHGSLLAVNANPNRTSIVKRGKWVLENLLCTPPPPPPPEVLGTLPPEGSGLTVRQRMELHRSEPTCFSCHAQMDPIGFALENFDPLGRFRTSDEGATIDNRGEFPDGRAFAGGRELASVVSNDRRFKVCVAEKLFTFSLGRNPNDSDRCTINRIALGTVSPTMPVSAAVMEMINSDAFRKQRGDGAIP